MTNTTTAGGAHMTEIEAEAKAIAIELKADGEAGAFAAVFATFDVVDAHDDVTRPGAFKIGTEVLIGGYNHNTGVLPVGRGTIKSDATRAWVEGSFFTSTTAGRETYEAVKAAGPLMEWSYLLRPTRFEYGEHEGKRVRFLNEIEVFSVDPVLKGAGVGTGTASIKSLGSFHEHIDGARAALVGAVARAKSLADLRASEGREIGAEGREAIEALLAACDEAKSILGDQPATAQHINPNMQAAHMQYLAAVREG